MADTTLTKLQQTTTGQDTGADAQLNVQELKPGTYTFSVVATDDVGQTSQAAQVIVTVRGALVVTVGANKQTYAPTETIALTAKLAGGGPVKSYVWSVKSA